MLASKTTKLCRALASERRGRWLMTLGLAAGLAVTTTPAASWTAVIQPDPITRQQRCLLSSDSVITAAGHDDTTPIVLIFNGDSLLAITQSELDPSFGDLQLVVDKNPPIHSEKIVQKKILVFDQNLPDLVRQLREGRQVTVYLRFWPTWPATQAFPVNFSLVGFSKMHDARTQNCQPPASANSAAR
ncbi:MAG: hypothetical protein IPK63_20805 [Candidatus Competibacteraceae bacterium]|nr:hypothetical protein [Candidatus Competibacteraceae bacterium]